MTRIPRHSTPDVSRRAFLAMTGGALAGAAVFGLDEPTAAGTRHPQRGGTLRFATRSDASGLDPHRNTIYPVSMPLAATTQGLLDLNLRCELVPGVATAWEASSDLRSYTFTLRPGVLFHNGQAVDAPAVKWNFERMRDPKTSHAFTRAALEGVQDIEVVDTSTVRFHLREPSAAFPANVVYYPCNLIAPDSVAQANSHPIGCGPFKFVKWERNDVTELVRFEQYWETDAAGHSLPYLDRIIGRPKKEDQVRLTSLRAGEVDLIDNMGYPQAADFSKRYAGKFQTWDVPNLGTSFILFNLDKGPFTEKQVRLAAAHAIDRTAIQQAVFSGRGEIARGFYGPASPWHTDGAQPWPEYDPEKARFLLRKARAVGTTVVLQSLFAFPYTQQTGELVQAMWADVGFKVLHNMYDESVSNQKRRSRDFHADSTSASYRWDPDGWFSRQVLSTSPQTKTTSGFRHERADQLIVEARRTADRQKRLELYAAIESIVNQEVPMLYLHHLTALQAGSRNLRGYQPAISGPFSVQAGGIRTAWLI